MIDSQSNIESDKWISDDEWGGVSPQTHRRLLRNVFSATADATALTGCSQGGNGDTPTPLESEGGGDEGMTTDGDSTNQSSGRTPDHVISLALMNARFNPYSNTTSFSFRWHWAMFDQLAIHDEVSNKAKGMVVGDWEYTGNGQVTWSIRDTYTWHNGDDLTAEDVAIQLRVDKLTQTVHKGYGVQPLYESVETTGKYELTFGLAEPDISWEISEFGHMKRRTWLWAHRDIWGRYVEMFDDATTESKRASAQQEIMQAVQQSVWDNANVPGNSVWGFTSGEGNAAHSGPYDDYVGPFSDAEWSNGKITGDMIDYSLDWHRYPNQQQRTRAMQEDVIDVSYPPEPQSARGRPKGSGWGPADSLSEDQITPQMHSGTMGVLFNCQSDVTGDPRVRKAIHHIVPRKPLIEWVPDYGTYWVEDRIPPDVGQDEGVPWFDGNSNWSSGDLARLERYAHTEGDVDEQRATELPEAASFSKSSNHWRDLNGENVTLRFYAAVSDKEPIALRFIQIVKSCLDDFGLQTEVTAQEATIRADKTIESDDWELLFDNWGGAKSGLPFLDFSDSFKVQESLSGQSLPSNDNWVMDRVVEAPYPIGDPASDLQEVSVIDKLNELRTQMSDEERRQKVAEVSWIFNQSLPMMLINEEGGMDGYWLNHNNWAMKPLNDNLNPTYRYKIVEIGQYSYYQYMTRMKTEYFHPAEGGQ